MSDLLGGFDELEEELAEIMKTASSEKIQSTLESGADELIKDLKKLARPRSAMMAASHTHLVESFAKEQDGNDWKVGWGVYYGRMVEKGTRKMGAQPHLIPTWEANKERIYQNMTKRILGRLF